MTKCTRTMKRLKGKNRNAYDNDFPKTLIKRLIQKYQV